MENMLQIVNMTGNNAVDEIILPVTDGQLNIRAAAGKEGNAYSISAIEINKISDSTTMPSTIWLCGDSTVCNYYPLDSNNQAGWGQMLGKYVDNGWYIRNMAASGEYAKGFVDHGNFECIEKYGKSGDVFVISIGINDGKYYKGDEYKKVVSDMVKRAKAKGMDVILVKQQGRKGDSSLSPLLKSRYFAAELDQIASEQNCQVVDLFTLWQDYCVSIGAAKAGSMYIDNVHPNRTGADKLAELFASKFEKTTSDGNDIAVNPPQPAAELQDGQIYVLRNAESGLYLGAENANAANNTNIIQSGNNGAQAQFKAVSAGDGYYCFVSQLGDGASYAIDINGKKTADGTNIELYELNKGDNQQFKAVKNDDGSYKLVAKVANDASCISAEREGGNVQEWTLNGSAAQSWFIETAQSAAATTTTTTAPTTTTTTVTTAPETTTTAATETTAAAGMLGDVNLDGKVTVADAVAILQYIGNRDRYGLGEQAKINGDVDGASGLTAKDALVIQQVDAGIYKQSELPIR